MWKFILIVAAAFVIGIMAGNVVYGVKYRAAHDNCVAMCTEAYLDHDFLSDEIDYD